ncbi:hypothetical protein BST61_g11484 [Cercospora zeina]
MGALRRDSTGSSETIAQKSTNHSIRPYKSALIDMSPRFAPSASPPGFQPRRRDSDTRPRGFEDTCVSTCHQDSVSTTLDPTEILLQRSWQLQMEFLFFYLSSGFGPPHIRSAVVKKGRET